MDNMWEVTMRKYIKRFYSVLLSFVLAIGMFAALPQIAFGAVVCEIGAVQYASLFDALAAAVDNDCIRLLDNISENVPINVSARLTIDLNGYDLDLVNKDIEVTGELTVTNGGTLTVGSMLKVDGGTLVANANLVSGDFGILTDNSATVTFNGNINSARYGAFAENLSVVTVTGNVTSTGSHTAAVYADWNGIVAVTGNILASGVSSNAVYCSSESQITISGNITASGSGGTGVAAEDDGIVTVSNGTITAQDTGVDAHGLLTVVTINGDISAGTGFGAAALGGSTVTVTGNITSGGNNASSTVIAKQAGTLVVNGNITATHANGAGAWADVAGQVTINGTITAPGYANIGGIGKSATEFEATTSKPGYREYSDGVSFVWVQLPAPGQAPGQPNQPSNPPVTPYQTPSTGDPFALISLSTLLLVVGLFFMVQKKRLAVS
jgi:hypothetical protein